MKSLPNIDITKQQVEFIYEQNCFNFGTESTVYEMPSLFGCHTLAKIWDDCSEETTYRKFEKLKRLYQLDLLREINDVKILNRSHVKEK